MVYRPRIVDSILDRKLSVFGAVVITGPKGCGKTTTAKQKAKSVIEFQDEDRREGYLSVASEMPSKLLEGTMPVVMQTSSLLSPGFVPFPRFLLGRGILPPLSGPLNDSLRYISSICISDSASALKGGSVSKSISRMRLLMKKEVLRETPHTRADFRREYMFTKQAQYSSHVSAGSFELERRFLHDPSE